MLFQIVLATLAVTAPGAPAAPVYGPPIVLSDVGPAECAAEARRYTKTTTRTLNGVPVTTQTRAHCIPLDAEARAAVAVEQVSGNGLPPFLPPPAPAPSRSRGPEFDVWENYREPPPPPNYGYVDPRTAYDGLPPVIDSNGVPRPVGSASPPPYDVTDPYLRSPDPWEREAACRARRPQC